MCVFMCKDRKVGKCECVYCVCVRACVRPLLRAWLWITPADPHKYLTLIFRGNVVLLVKAPGLREEIRASNPAWSRQKV